MSEPHQFRHYLIVQDAAGANVELERSADKVSVLAFDTLRLEFAACHVLLHPLAERAAFEEACRRLRGHGHPLLARMTDFGEDDGNPFYITSAVDGEPLRAYLGRQQELPGWLAVMLASRALDAAAAVCSRGDYLLPQPLNSLRLVQVGAQTLVVVAADFRLHPAGTTPKSRAQRANFEKQGKFLRAFLLEQAGSSATLPDHPLNAADFTELLAGCLQAASPAAVSQMHELRQQLQKLAPEHLSGEIPAPQKPRALIAPLLAGYQEVARAVASRVRIQSQRLDMTNPYSMRGTLAKAGRPVLVEQIPPVRLVGRRVLDALRETQKLTRKNDHPHLVTVALVHEAESLTCLAEEIVEGISLAELLRERAALEVNEAYLVLAGLDSALADLDSTSLPGQKLRLEDIHLLLSRARETPRGARLLTTRLTDWPSFSVVLRGHPCLASMSGRGTDPGLLLPPGATTSATVPTRWHGGWLAAVGRFLLGLEHAVGASLLTADPALQREREGVAGLLDEEIARTIEGQPSSRAEFLSRFARLVHQRAPGPTAAPAPAPAVSTAPVITEIQPVPGRALPKTTEDLEAEDDGVQVFTPGGAIAAALTGSALTQGLPTPKPEKPTAGFAELLFQGEETEVNPDEPDWARRPQAQDGLPTHFEASSDPTPVWLKAAVFVLGSMAVGGFLSHLSGQALWQKHRAQPPSVEVAPVGAADPAAGLSAQADLEKLRTQASTPVADDSDPAPLIAPPPPPSGLKKKLVD